MARDNGTGAQGQASAPMVEELYTGSRAGVYRYLLGYGLAPDRAQDLTQEAFLRLVAALNGGGQLENPRAWVYRVAHNLAMDALQERRPEPGFEGIADGLRDGASNAEETMLANEARDGFHRAVAGLSPQQRACLELRVQGLRYREIAAILDVKTSTVGEFLRRAIEGLRKWKS